MSVQPIDLQTLFMRLSQVGKEQAALNEATHVAQSVKGAEIAKRSEELARTVNENKDLENGPDAIKEDEQRGGRRNGEQNKEPGQLAEKKEQQQRNIFQDPELGTKIDLSG